MKRHPRIKRQFQTRAPVWAARAAAVFPHAQPDGGTLLVPPTRPGSLGDEAMMTVCMEHLHREGRDFAIVDFVPGDRWPDEPTGTKHVDLAGFFGASYLRSVPGIIRTLRDFERLWCLGADVMDGHYSEVGSLRRVTLVHLAADLGLEASILGFSFNETPSELVVEAMRALPSSVGIHARDPRSHTRMIARLGRPVKLVADVAFGLRASQDLAPMEREVVAWIHAQRLQGRRVVALNVSQRAFESSGGGDISQAVDAYAAALTALLRGRPRVSMVCVPHDYRRSDDEMNDAEVLAAIVDRVGADVSERVLLPEQRLTAPFAKRIAGEVDAVLSGRMHFVIAALGQGTPAAGLSYQGKLGGLYDHFGVLGLAIEPSDALTDSGLLHLLDRLLDEHAALSARIAGAKPSVEALQRGNFEAAAPRTKNPRLLVISPEATHPANKGNRMRIMDLCDRAERLGWEVHLAHVERTATDRTLMAAHWGDRYHPLPYRYPVRIHKKASQRLRGALTGDYEFRIDDWYDDGIDAYLLALQRRYAFDAVMVEYAHQSKAFELFGEGVLKVLDTHDELAHRFAQQEAFGLRRTGFSTTRAEESIGLSRSDVVLAIQDRERDRFRSRATSDVVTVGHHVELFAATQKPFTARLLFLGSRNQANIDAIEFFMDAVWPLVAGRAKLLIAGSICEMVDIPDGIEQLPVVEDLSIAYDEADLVIVPMRFGTGLKIKTIEAMGRGKPIVSTRVGAEGLERCHGEALVVADTAEDFAAAILALIDDTNTREGLSRAAAEFASVWNTESEAAFAAVLGRVDRSQAAD